MEGHLLYLLYQFKYYSYPETLSQIHPEYLAKYLCTLWATQVDRKLTFTPLKQTFRTLNFKVERELKIL
jgi:hypothetical protein